MSDKGAAGRGSSPPRPAKAGILFPRRPKEEQQADMAQVLGEWIYSRGFRLAARRLAVQITENDTEEDFLIYPIVYLYRHHAELVLKGVITCAFGLLDRKPTTHDVKTLGGHGLLKLWRVAQPLLNAACERAGDPPFPEDELERAESYIRQLDDNDPDGQRFRYATAKPDKTDRSGPKPSLSLALKLSNVGAIAHHLEWLADYLESIEWSLTEFEDAKAEFMRKLSASSGAA